ncbi:bifunctional precorrin-2 dehydrogenase/sirohydrochlorin ferrochelatase [Candidatus Sumerlaeota bacterium]|nr:bifunctional precorrin-2 dehydrogenase/sirohydrochlorin ferrochelatase [Candidatus Sumerlaeota bacterium]
MNTDRERDYPINLRLAGRLALVVGGGEVAEGRVAGLIEADASVTVVSPEATPDLRRLAGDGAVELISRTVRESDLEGATLVLVCTDDSALNAEVARWARARGVLVNVADDPPHCDFALPSTFRRGDILVAVSTSGRSPGFSAALRRRLESQVDEADAQALEIIGEQRRAIRPLLADQAQRFALINHLVAMDLAQVIRERGLSEARSQALKTVAQWLGK